MEILPGKIGNRTTKEKKKKKNTKLVVMEKDALDKSEILS